MELKLMNEGTESVAIHGDDWVDAIGAGAEYTVNRSDTVVIVGDKPDVREQLAQGKEILTELARKVITAIAGRTSNPKAAPAAALNFRITNLGDKDVRVILGDGVSDLTITAQGTQNCKAMGYLELRELGDVNPNIDKQPSEAA
jgi:hypothetical protein